MSIRSRSQLALLAPLLVAACGGGESGTDASSEAPADSPDAADTTLAVYALDPVTGPVAGGTVVTVSGRGFADGATVRFGDATAADVVVVAPAQITLATPPASSAGAVDVTVENPGGTSSTLVGGYTYTLVDPALPVGWCNIQHPAAAGTAAGVPTEPIYGRAYVAGCTDADARCEVLVAEVGYGDPAIDPSASVSSYLWTPASYNAGHTEDDDDEYSATLSPDTDGTFAYVFRFSTDLGAHFTYCDLDGNDTSAGGFDTGQMGALTVADRTIGWCNLQHPPATTAAAGTGTEAIYGRVHVAGCTDGHAYCGGILAEVGFGDPGDDPAAFAWSAATYNAGHTLDDNDEYMGVLTSPSVGTFEYAYRFSGDGGETWTDCDLDGTDDGYDSANGGVLTVE